jgi:hypothetical protein
MTCTQIQGIRFALSCSALCAAASIALVLMLGSALAQTSLTDEIVRKAQKGEQEDGFCARTGWANGDSADDFAKFLRDATTSSGRATNFSGGNCVFNRVTAIKKDKGDKCVSYTFYTCMPGKACGWGKSVDCLKPDGAHYTRTGD